MTLWLRCYARSSDNLKPLNSTTVVSSVTKIARLLTRFEELLTIKSYKTLITWSFRITWQIKNHYISPTTVLMATLGRMVTYLEGYLAIKPMEIKIGDHSRSGDKSKPLYLHYQSVYSHQTWQDSGLPWGANTHNDTLNTLFFKITWQTETIIFLLPQCLWPPDLEEWWLTLRSSCP